MFTDIEGSKAMTEWLGDTRAQKVLRVRNATKRSCRATLEKTVKKADRGR